MKPSASVLRLWPSLALAVLLLAACLGLSSPVHASTQELCTPPTCQTAVGTKRERAVPTISSELKGPACNQPSVLEASAYDVEAAESERSDEKAPPCLTWTLEMVGHFNDERPCFGLAWGADRDQFAAAAALPRGPPPSA